MSKWAGRLRGGGEHECCHFSPYLPLRNNNFSMYCCWNSFFLLRFSKPSALVHVSASSIKISVFGKIGNGRSLEDEVAAVSRRR